MSIRMKGVEAAKINMAALITKANSRERFESIVAYFIVSFSGVRTFKSSGVCTMLEWVCYGITVVPIIPIAI